jgi:hypothetical protein
VGGELLSYGYDDGINNRWNNTNQEGNYWSNYETRYPLAGNNGKYYDQPYSIGGAANSFDYYPLVNQV